MYQLIICTGSIFFNSPADQLLRFSSSSLLDLKRIFTVSNVRLLQDDTGASNFNYRSIWKHKGGHAKHGWLNSSVGLMPRCSPSKLFHLVPLSLERAPFHVTGASAHSALIFLFPVLQILFRTVAYTSLNFVTQLAAPLLLLVEFWTECCLP
jgi:hypothetical protein